jgi:RND superfamily putative drug exporter
VRVRLFWPFIPKSADDAAGDPVVTGFWHRIATAVAARPVWVAATSIGLLAVLATGLLATPTGLSQTEQFRVRAESVSGYDAVAAHFGSLSDPTRVIGSTERAAGLQQAIAGTPGVMSVTEAGRRRGPGAVHRRHRRRAAT